MLARPSGPTRMMTHAEPDPPEQAVSVAGTALAAVDQYFPIVYDELRRLAHRQLLLEPDGHTLTTTDLVHHAYLRLSDQTRAHWQSRSHFLAVAAMAMRRILVDHARGRRTTKRGGELHRVPLESMPATAQDRDELVMALDEALERLRALDARQALVVQCRFFGGMTEEETAEALNIGLRTAKRDWAKAKAWLYAELFTGG